MRTWKTRSDFTSTRWRCVPASSGSIFPAIAGAGERGNAGCLPAPVYPFDELVENLNLQRDMSRSALFDVMVVLQNTGLHTAEQQQEAGGLKVSVHKGADVQVSKFDLTFAFVEAGKDCN